MSRDGNAKKGSEDLNYRLNASEDVHRTMSQPDDHTSGLRSEQSSVQPQVRDTPLDHSMAKMRLEQLFEHMPEQGRPPLVSIDKVLTSGSAPRSASHLPPSGASSGQVKNGNSSSDLAASTAREPSVEKPIVSGGNYTVENRRSLCPPPDNWRERNSIQTSGIGGLDGAQVRQRPPLHRATPYEPQGPTVLGPITAPAINSSSKENNPTSGGGELETESQTEAALQEYFRDYDTRSDQTRARILDYHVGKIFDSLSASGPDSAVPSGQDQLLALPNDSALNDSALNGSAPNGSAPIGSAPIGNAPNGSAPMPTQHHTLSKFFPNRANSHQVRWSRSPNTRVRETMPAAETRDVAEQAERVASPPQTDTLLRDHRSGASPAQRKSSQAKTLDGDGKGRATLGKTKDKFLDWLKGLWSAVKPTKRLNHFMRKGRRMSID